MRLVLLGPPGSGKGTQAALICAEFGLQHLSTGNMLRDEIARRSDLGLEVEATVRSGALVDDATVNRIVFARLDRDDSFLLDGYPRNASQAGALDGYLGDGRALSGAVLLRVPGDEVVRRLSGRMTCSACGFTGSGATGGGCCPGCGGLLEVRPDDSPEVILRRLGEYARSTAPLESYYGSRLLAVDGSGSVDEVWVRLREALVRWS